MLSCRVMKDDLTDEQLGIAWERAERRNAPTPPWVYVVATALIVGVFVFVLMY